MLVELYHISRINYFTRFHYISLMKLFYAMLTELAYIYGTTLHFMLTELHYMNGILFHYVSIITLPKSQYITSTEYSKGIMVCYITKIA